MLGGKDWKVWKVLKFNCKAIEDMLSQVRAQARVFYSSDEYTQYVLLVGLDKNQEYEFEMSTQSVAYNEGIISAKFTCEFDVLLELSSEEFQRCNGDDFKCTLNVDIQFISDCNAMTNKPVEPSQEVYPDALKLSITENRKVLKYAVVDTTNIANWEIDTTDLVLKTCNKSFLNRLDITSNCPMYEEYTILIKYKFMSNMEYVNLLESFIESRLVSGAYLTISSYYISFYELVESGFIERANCEVLEELIRVLILAHKKGIQLDFCHKEDKVGNIQGMKALCVMELISVQGFRLRGVGVSIEEFLTKFCTFKFTHGELCEVLKDIRYMACTLIDRDLVHKVDNILGEIE